MHQHPVQTLQVPAAKNKSKPRCWCCGTATRASEESALHIAHGIGAPRGAWYSVPCDGRAVHWAKARNVPYSIKKLWGGPCKCQELQHRTASRATRIAYTGAWDRFQALRFFETGAFAGAVYGDLRCWPCGAVRCRAVSCGDLRCLVAPHGTVRYLVRMSIRMSCGVRTESTP
jgi:hypothetical protein